MAKKISEGRQLQAVRDEIAQGELDYKADQTIEEVDYDLDTYEDVQPKEPEIWVTEEESRANLEDGINEVTKIIQSVTGRIIGARKTDSYQGGYYNYSCVIGETSDQKILEHLAFGRWSAVHDDEIVTVGRNSGDGGSFSILINGIEVQSSAYSQFYKGSTTHVFGKRVTQQDYAFFVDRVNELLQNSWTARNVEPAHKRELPKDLKETIDTMRYNKKTEEVLKKGTIVPAGEISFNHGPYGASYFGSGGAYGSVKAYQLSAWKNGERVAKSLITKSGDSGFIAGPIGATIESDTIIIASGGDCIGDEGRTWGEIYICE